MESSNISGETPNSSLLTSYSWLITGGCGFIGLNLIDFMLKKGFTNFRILDNLTIGSKENLETLLSEHGTFEKKEDPNRILYMLNSENTQSSRPAEVQIQLMIGDIKDPEICIQVTKNIDIAVHLAAQSGVPTSMEDPYFDCETNVLGTLNVLEACRTNNVDKFIFASSGAPLGEVDPPIHEKKLPKPISPYGASKLAGEAYCHAYYKSFGIKTVVLRFGNVYGPRSSHKTSVVAKFFKRAIEGKPLEIYGDGTQTRDFIYVEDLCNAIYLALKKLSNQSSYLESGTESSVISANVGSSVPSPNEPDLYSVLRPQLYSKTKAVAGEVFQIATFKETTVEEIAYRIKELVENKNWNKIKIIHSKERLGDVKRNFSDIRKARNLLVFRPEFGLKKGLSKTWKTMKMPNQERFNQ
ncbi:MAG: NAD-dependent epimerase/dehydratase family protein [Desulfobacteraceae bacterium]|jgi:UDP-glucose 4-epimerase